MGGGVSYRFVAAKHFRIDRIIIGLNSQVCPDCDSVEISTRFRKIMIGIVDVIRETATQ